MSALLGRGRDVAEVLPSLLGRRREGARLGPDEDRVPALQEGARLEEHRGHTSAVTSLAEDRCRSEHLTALRVTHSAAFMRYHVKNLSPVCSSRPV